MRISFPFRFLQPIPGYDTLDSPSLAAPYFLACFIALSARVNLVEATTFMDLVIFSMFLTDFNLRRGGTRDRIRGDGRGCQYTAIDIVKRSFALAGEN
jgi:hypothetical protein